MDNQSKPPQQDGVMVSVPLAIAALALSLAGKITEPLENQLTQEQITAQLERTRGQLIHIFSFIPAVTMALRMTGGSGVEEYLIHTSKIAGPQVVNDIIAMINRMATEMQEQAKPGKFAPADPKNN